MSTEFSHLTDSGFIYRLERQADDGHGWNNARAMLLESANRIRKLSGQLDACAAERRHAREVAGLEIPL